MHEYTLENGHEIATAALQVGHVPLEQYTAAHQTVCFACHDVIVKLGDKYLLIERDNVPAKGILWPLGGRVLRGVPVEESLKDRVLKESGLSLANLRFLGVGRTMFETDPFGHGKGTDTLNLMYLADGEGDIKLDSLHTSPTLFTKEEYQSSLRPTLHPYVVEMLDTAFA